MNETYYSVSDASNSFMSTCRKNSISANSVKKLKYMHTFVKHWEDIVTEHEQFLLFCYSAMHLLQKVDTDAVKFD